MAKKWWQSKTFWVNLIAAAALIAQGITGREIVIAPETQALLLALINLLLRAITRQPIEWR